MGGREEAASDASDIALYSDVAEFFPYTIDDFYALPEATRLMLYHEAARLRARREAAIARATFFGTRMALARSNPTTYAYGVQDLAACYPAME